MQFKTKKEHPGPGGGREREGRGLGEGSGGWGVQGHRGDFESGASSLQSIGTHKEAHRETHISRDLVRAALHLIKMYRAGSLGRFVLDDL